MASAYRLLKDVSFPRPIRPAGELADGSVLYETVGVNYATGSYVLESELTPRDAGRAADGELNDLLEASDSAAAEAYRLDRTHNETYSTFVPEHEAERVALQEYGHEVLTRQEATGNTGQSGVGTGEAAAAVEAAKASGADQRPGLTAESVPSLTTVEGNPFVQKGK